MAIYYPDGNGGRKVIGGFSPSEMKLTGFSQVAGTEGELADDDNLLTAFAKLQNRKQAPAQLILTKTPVQSGTLTYSGASQTPVWSNYNTAEVKIVAGSTTSATNAGTYSVVFTLVEGYAWEDGRTENKSVTWTITRATISTVPSQSNTLFYDGTPKAPAWRNYNSTQLTLGGTTSATAVGTYTATFTPKANYMWSGGSTSAKSVTWAIGSSVADDAPSQAATLSYTGTAQSPTWNNYDTLRLTIGGSTSATNAGTYTATFTPKSGVVWGDGTSTAKNVNWTIAKASVAIPTVTNTSFSYNGNNQAPVVGTYNASFVTVTGNAPQVNAGTYKIVCSLKDKINCQWADGKTADVETTWTIRKVTVDIPTVYNTTFTYDGASHAPSISSYNTNAITVTGNSAQTNEGTYTIVFALKDKTNYQWTDGTTANVQKSWSIGKTTVSIPTVTNTTFTYDGASHAPTVSSYDTNLITVTNTAQTIVGSYKTVLALKDKNSCQWSDGTTANIEKAWTITKALLSVPIVTDTSFENDGKTHAPTISSYNTNLITVTGNTPQSAEGSYTLVLALKDKANYQWADGSTTDKTFTWTISISYDDFYAGVTMLKSNTMRFGTDVFILADS